MQLQSTVPEHPDVSWHVYWLAGGGSQQQVPPAPPQIVFVCPVGQSAFGSERLWQVGSKTSWMQVVPATQAPNVPHASVPESPQGHSPWQATATGTQPVPHAAS